MNDNNVMMYQVEPFSNSTSREKSEIGVTDLTL